MGGEWPIALALSLPMLAGSLVGVRVGRRVPSDVARSTFANLLAAVVLVNAVIVLA